MRSAHSSSRSPFRLPASRLAGVAGALLAAACSSGPSVPDGSSTPALDAGASPVFPRSDAGQTVYTGDAAVTPVEDSAPPPPADDYGPLGSVDNPANSCAEIHFQYPTWPSGTFHITELGEAPRATYCDMTTAGGGWTKVSATFAPTDVVLVMGSAGRTMLKCADDGAAAILSPVITDASWQWTGSSFAVASGDWTVNGATVACGSSPEYAGTSCATWWGFGCDEGGAGARLVPGVTGPQATATCGTTTSAHTSGAFSICGSDDYAHYSVFVRAN
jgi:hypothetical protein